MLNNQQPNGGNSGNSTNANARNFRLEKTMQTLRDMILNMNRQEQMGVPVDPVEKQLFAQVGKALKSLQGKDDTDFNLEGAVIVRKLTGAAPFAANTGFNQNPHQGAQQSTINGYTDPFANNNPNQAQANTGAFGQGQSQFGGQQQQQQQAYGGGAPKPGFNPLGHFKNNGKGMGPSDQRYLQAATAKLGGIGLPNDYILMGAEIAEILVNEHQFPADPAIDVACQAMLQMAQQGVQPDEIVGMRVVKGISSQADATNGQYNPFAKGNKSPLDIFNEILAEGEDKNTNNPDSDSDSSTDTSYGF